MWEGKVSAAAAADADADAADADAADAAEADWKHEVTPERGDLIMRAYINKIFFFCYCTMN